MHMLVTDYGASFIVTSAEENRSSKPEAQDG